MPVRIKEYVTVNKGYGESKTSVDNKLLKHLQRSTDMKIKAHTEASRTDDYQVVRWGIEIEAEIEPEVEEAASEALGKLAMTRVESLQAEAEELLAKLVRSRNGEDQ